jgi:predicted transcriptional regulator
MQIPNLITLREMAQSLIEMGYSQTGISEGSGVRQPTISRVLAGRGVSYESGKKIESFYEQIVSCKKKSSRSRVRN